MSFNADQYREAVRPWVFTVGGRSWEARPVSAEAVLAFHAVIRDRPGDARACERALLTLLRMAFPWRPSFWWRGDPALLLAGLSPAERGEALQDFFGYLEGKTRRPLPPPDQTTSSGPASPPSSPTGTAAA